MWRLERVMLLGVTLVACASTGCSHMSNTARGGAIGAGAGAGAGALIGRAAGNTGAGALIGTAAGTVIGGMIGNDIDQEEKRDMQGRVIAAEAREVDAHQQMAAQQAYSEVTVDQVVTMSQSGVPEQVIINQIRTTGSVFHLNSSEIAFLKSNAVSDAVIMEMQNTRNRPRASAPPPTVIRQPRQVYVEHEPPVIIHRRRPVQVIEVVPPPRPIPQAHFGVGFYKQRCW